MLNHHNTDETALVCLDMYLHRLRARVKYSSRGTVTPLQVPERTPCTQKSGKWSKTIDGQTAKYMQVSLACHTLSSQDRSIIRVARYVECAHTMCTMAKFTA